jgi:S-adenosylmethionine synthetase
MSDLAMLRKAGRVNFLRPDSKSQVTIEYQGGKAVRVDTVVLSTQHTHDVDQKRIKELVIEEVVPKSIPSKWIDSKTKFHINPTGRFVVGGPHGDAGLTGRKIIVDTYGGHGAHGGGAFSGKDPSKVDRSAAYAARHVAKNIVAAGFAEKCLVQLAYAIGVAEPVSVMVNDFGTSQVSGEVLAKAVGKVWSLKPAAIVEQFDLLEPKYRKTTNYGHFGRNIPELTWEKTDKVDALRDAVKTLKRM